MSQMDRRSFSKTTLGSLLAYSLLETVCTSDVLSAEVKPIAARWLAELNSRSNDLRGRELKQLEWQAEIEKLFSQVDLNEFLSYVDFERLIKNMKFREKGERAFRAKFPEVEGLPTKLVFGHQMFALKKSQSVVPHGHNNMATAFLILKGDFHGRHYDRIQDEDQHMIVKPTIDRRFGVGEYSTVTDRKDNVHWFKANSDTAYIFNIHVLNVDPEIKRGGRVYIDPNGEPLSGGKIRARKIKAREAFQLYG
ncbi:MAG: hypothetical protein GY768_12005 [Planctomycetaceae bacterium]|nr:hypothetical protein [Planctomycetaceae bacterium]